MTRLFSSTAPADGFHLTSTTHIAFSNSDLFSNCSLHLYFSLPPLIFVDPYELAHHARSYAFNHWGTANLELPIHAVPQSNSRLLLTVSPEHDLWNSDDPNPEVNEVEFGLEIKVPLHLRYGDPRSNSGYHTAEMDWPTGFLACPQILQGFSQTGSTLPPEVLSLFEPQTTSISAHSPQLVPIFPANNAHVHKIKVRVPVGNPSDLQFVEPGLAILILVSFFYLAWTSLRTARRMELSVGGQRPKTE